MSRIADKITTITDWNEPWLIYVYGDWGVGKTVFAAKAPNCLIIDTEGSTRTLRKHPDLRTVPILRAYTWDDVDKIKWDLIDNKSEKLANTEIVVIDTWSTLQKRETDKQLKDSKKDVSKVSEYEYKVNNDRMRQMLLDFKEATNRNIILLAHVKEEKDDDGNTIVIRPANTEATMNNVAAVADGVFYLDATYSIKEGTKRKLYTARTPKIRAKNRFSLPAMIENPDIKQIIDAAKE